MDIENRIVVIDNGSGVCKAGFSGDHLPHASFPSIMGNPRHQSHSLFSLNSCYIGEEALCRKGVLNLVYPIEHGIIKNWDAMELLWQYTFCNELRVPSEDHPVLLTEPPLNPRINKEKMCTVMFESLNVPALYIGIQAVLSLYSSALTTGLILDIGDGVSHVVPTFEGYAFNHAIQRINIAGHDITQYLSNLLSLEGFRFQSSGELEICREIKENCCYVAQNFEEESQKNDHQVHFNYELPDGTFLSVNKSRFQAPEILFKPNLIGIDSKGIGETVYDCIVNCDIDVRKKLFEGIMLSGGSTMFEGFSERVYSEVRAKNSTAGKIKVIAPKERKFSVWIGGSILGALDSFKQLMFTKEEYLEVGPEGVHRKCF